MRATLALVAAGFGLIAVAYGLARFAYGLFLPAFRDELGLSESLAGAIGAGSFLGYCIAIAAAVPLTERFGPRLVATAAALVACLGTLLIAVAPSAGVLAAAVLFAGTSTGLASPPMAAAVARIAAPHRQGRANAAINAGTSMGIVASGALALTLGEAWRTAYLWFAGAGAAACLAVAVCTPATGVGEGRFDIADLHRLARRPAALRLLAAAFAMGVASTAVWTFGGELLQRQAGWPRAEVADVWIVLGAAGLAGAGAGSLIRRFGLRRTHRASICALALAIVAFGGAGVAGDLAYPAAAAFGAAYIMLTGVYLVWGTTILSDRPALGLAAPFLALAVGQVGGAPLFGLLLDLGFAEAAVVLFALAAGAACLFDGAGPARPEEAL